MHPYVYAGGNPVSGIDPEGLAAHLAAGFAVGAGSELAIQGFDNWRKGRNVFDRHCYDWGEVALSGVSGALGGGIGWRWTARYGPRSLTRVTGKEWSHFVPREWVDRLTKGRLNKALNKRGGVNGRWATPRQHYRHDGSRWPTDHRQWGDRLPKWARPIHRTPEWLRGVAAGTALGSILGEGDGK